MTEAVSYQMLLKYKLFKIKVLAILRTHVYTMRNISKCKTLNLTWTRLLTMYVCDSEDCVCLIEYSIAKGNDKEELMTVHRPFPIQALYS